MSSTTLTNYRDDNYNEAEDDDYRPENDGVKHGVGSHLNKVRETPRDMKNYDAIENPEGGLIKTRHQRQEEERRQREADWKVTNSKQTGTNIDSIWASLKSASHKALKSNGSSAKVNTEPITHSKDTSKYEVTKVKIKRTYEFAGKVVNEEKWVDSNSEEAKAQKNSTKLKAKIESKKSDKKKRHNYEHNGLHLRKKRRRPGLLEAVINNSSAAKISTLEKSRLDWAKYVDKEKIHDELKYKNKAGYLANQDFLGRVDQRQDTLYRDAKASSKQRR